MPAESLRELIQRIAREGLPEELYSVAGTVGNVNTTDKTCDVTPAKGDAEIKGVRFMSVLGGDNGFVQVPADGSQVIVTFLNKYTGFISQYGEIQGYIMETANESLKTILQDILTAINQITVTTPQGPSGTPVNAVDFTNISQRIENFLLE